MRSSTLLLATIVAGVLLLVHLGSLVSGVSNGELEVHTASNSLHAIAHQPVFWPYKLLVWLFGLLPGHPYWTLRLGSVVFAGIAIGAMTYVMRRWYGPRAAFFGFVIFVCSAWLLHAGRLAGYDAVYLAIVPLLLLANVLLIDQPYTASRAYFWLVVQLLAVSVPGMLWFVVLNIVLLRGELHESPLTLRRFRASAGLVGTTVVLLAPLVIGLAVGSTTSLALQLIGLPTDLPAIGQILDNAKQAFLFVAIHGQAGDDQWLNHIPIFDAFMTAMLLAGLYFYGSHFRAARTRLLAGYLLIGFVLIAAGGLVTESVIVPVLYLISVAGIAYLLHLWLGVFPRNPLARSFGIGLIGLAVIASSWYGLRQYFVAWPHHTPVRSSFHDHHISRPKL